VSGFSAGLAVSIALDIFITGWLQMPERLQAATGVRCACPIAGNPHGDTEPKSLHCCSPVLFVIFIHFYFDNIKFLLYNLCIH
jgi:hypothetical protein